MCSLLAEWTGQPRDALARRCSHGAVPPRFRFGPWRGELTAVVPLEVAMHTVRADESRPPAGLATADSRSSVDAAELAHIAPVHGAPTASKPSAALEVVNNTAARAIIMVQGVPVGWVNAYRRGRFEGFRPGRYRVGALRPLGALRLAPKLVELPGEVVLGGPLQPLVSPRNAPTAG